MKTIKTITIPGQAVPFFLTGSGEGINNVKFFNFIDITVLQCQLMRKTSPARDFFDEDYHGLPLD